MKRTSIDANVLIAAFQGEESVASRALRILEDPERILVVSDYLRLEVLPKPFFHKRADEVAFMRTVLDAAEDIPTSPLVTSKAVEMASKYDMSPVDALHIGAAIIGGVDEFVTLEKPAKPMCRVREVKVVSIHSEAEG